MKKFATSRITVGRALHESRQLGLIERRAGSGSYVGTSSQDSGLLFGLLIPNLADTEIFGPICQGMSEAPQTRKNALLWGNITPDWDTKDEQAWELCRQYIAKRVAGVFFAPLERTAASEQTSQQILQPLNERASLLFYLTAEIGVAAVAVMLERLETPGMPIRDILLDCKLVVRESCGAKKAETLRNAGGATDELPR